MSRKRAARLLAIGLCAGAAASIARCTAPVFDSSVHTLGQYGLCLRRLSDACVAVDGGCQTLAATTGTVSLGDQPYGAFLWSRSGLPPMRGTRIGPRFSVSTMEEKVATVCGCTADVTETIRGELAVARASGLDCAGAADADAGCGDEAAASMFFDGGLPDDSWLSGATADGGTGDELYGSFRATVTDDVKASDASQRCPCLPCRVVYEALGTK